MPFSSVCYLLPLCLLEVKPASPIDHCGICIVHTAIKVRFDTPIINMHCGRTRTELELQYRTKSSTSSKPRANHSGAVHWCGSVWLASWHALRIRQDALDCFRTNMEYGLGFPWNSLGFGTIMMCCRTWDLLEIQGLPRVGIVCCRTLTFSGSPGPL